MKIRLSKRELERAVKFWLTDKGYAPNEKDYTLSFNNYEKLKGKDVDGYFDEELEIFTLEVYPNKK